MKYIILLLIPIFSFSQLDTAMYNGEGKDKYIVFRDGYQEGESNLFISDVFSSTEYMFNQSPFKEYRDYFNVFTQFVTPMKVVLIILDIILTHKMQDMKVHVKILPYLVS